MAHVPLTHDEQVKWDWPLQEEDAQVIDEADRFQVTLDAAYFQPNEIKVRTYGNILDIDCAHEIKGKGAIDISRNIHRNYHLPADVDVGSLKSHLGRDGKLVIQAGKQRR